MRIPPEIESEIKHHLVRAISWDIRSLGTWSNLRGLQYSNIYRKIHICVNVEETTDVRKINTLIAACFARNLEMVKFVMVLFPNMVEILKNPSHIVIYNQLCKVVGNTSFEVFKFLLDRMFDKNPYGLNVWELHWHTIKSERLDLLKYVCEKYPFRKDTKIPVNYAHYTSFEVLKYLHEDLSMDFDFDISDYRKKELIFEMFCCPGRNLAKNLEYILENGFADVLPYYNILEDASLCDDHIEMIIVYYEKTEFNTILLAEVNSTASTFDQYNKPGCRKILNYLLEIGLKVFFEASD